MEKLTEFVTNSFTKESESGIFGVTKPSPKSEPLSPSGSTESHNLEESAQTEKDCSVDGDLGEQNNNIEDKESACNEPDVLVDHGIKYCYSSSVLYTLVCRLVLFMDFEWLHAL